jgi:2-polyprenyl-3-methyl-5-hydroxy-6-metoxy-1,4-benzoquinol methylase
MKESEIRPQKLFNQYLQLAKKDNEIFFSDHARFTEIPCPSCGNEKQMPGLEKFGFTYVLCTDCASLYLSPRPPAEMYDLYYREAESVKFWSTHFYKETAEARRKKIYRPRAEIVTELTNQYGLDSANDSLFADIGAGYGLFLEEVEKLNLFDRVIGIEPSPKMAQVCRERGFDVIQKYVGNTEDITAGASFATAFEVLEHVLDPLAFLSSAKRILRRGGLLMFTTLTVSGFDIQVLWEKSKSVYPPHHINLLSIDGFRRLVERSGLSLVHLCTPGALDVDIVRNICIENSDVNIPRFAASIINAPEKVRTKFQSFLKANNLSSHIRIIASRLSK